MAAFLKVRERSLFLTTTPPDFSCFRCNLFLAPPEVHDPTCRMPPLCCQLQPPCWGGGESICHLTNISQTGSSSAGGAGGVMGWSPTSFAQLSSSKPHVTGKQADTSLLWQMWAQPPEALQCEGTAGAGAALATPAARPSWVLLGPAHAGTAGRAQQGAKTQHGDSREMNSLPDTLHLFLESRRARKPQGLVFSPPWLREPAGCSISKPSSQPKQRAPGQESEASILSERLRNGDHANQPRMAAYPFF